MNKTFNTTDKLSTILTVSVTMLCTLFFGACNENTPREGISEKSDLAVTAKSLTPYQKRNIQDEVFYFVLPDRFNNGDSANDQGAKDIAISFGGFDPTNAQSFHGGDIKGLTQKLPYLEQMGISAIWLTPILRNQAVQGDISGYHGYWVLDFTEIDPHLGSNADLKAFIEQAHQKNIKVFFDIITNHTADVIKYKQCHGEDGSGWSESGESCPYISLAEIAQGTNYDTVIQAGNETLKTPYWLNDPKHYHNQGDSTFEGENSLNGDFFGLDDLNTESPDVVNGMVDIYKNIISEFKPDGFRIDTVKHVNIEFWQQFIPALDEHAKSIGIDNFFMFGEVYSGNPVELSTFTQAGKLPSVLDFAMQSVFYQTLIEGMGTNKFNALFSQDHLYANANKLLNFTGNHDMGRFSYLLEKQDKFSRTEIAKRVKLASAMSFFLRGIPVVYYGDEQGFIGTGDNHNARQDMMPSQVKTHNEQSLLLSDSSTASDNFDMQHPLYIFFAELANMYHQHAALRYGKQEIIYSSDEQGLLVIRKTYQQEDYIVAFNTSTDAKSTDISTSKHYQIIHHPTETAAINNSDKIIVSLPGLSFSIIKAK